MNLEILKTETGEKLGIIKSALIEGSKNEEVRRIDNIFISQIQGEDEPGIRKILDKIIKEESDDIRGEFDKYHNQLIKTLTAGEILLALRLVDDDQKTALYYWLLFRSQQEMQKNNIDQNGKYSLLQLLKKLVEKIRQ